MFTENQEKLPFSMYFDLLEYKKRASLLRNYELVYESVTRLDAFERLIHGKKD